MAGLQSCLRTAFLNNSVRLINKKSVFHQPNRCKHLLIFQLSLPKNSHCKRTRVLLSTNLTCVHRFASTNVTPKDVNVPQTGEIAKDVTNAATDNVSPVVIDEASLPPAPSPLPPAGESSEVLDFISTGLKEPSFESLGLGSWWPSGIIQQILEYLHINLDLPWWAAIAIVTVVFRAILFPCTVMSRKNATNMNNNLPELQRLQLKLTEARQTGNYYEAALHTQELMDFMKTHKIGPLGSVLPALAQTPVFISMYWALKRMAEAPVESLKTGGLWWFTDLTVPDPYYILPIYTAASFLIVIELGAEGVSSRNVHFNFMKYFLRSIPIVVLPFTLSMPEVVLWYWSVSNCITIATVGLFKIQAVRTFFGIPKMIKHDPSKLPIKKKGAVQGFKDSMENMKVLREVEERERLNTVTFESAGKGAIPRTFKKNPKASPEKAAVKLSPK